MIAVSHTSNIIPFNFARPANDNQTPLTFVQWQAAFAIGASSYDIGLTEDDYPADMCSQEIDAYQNGFNDRRVATALRNYVP